MVTQVAMDVIFLSTPSRRANIARFFGGRVLPNPNDAGNFRHGFELGDTG